MNTTGIEQILQSIEDRKNGIVNPDIRLVDVSTLDNGLVTTTSSTSSTNSIIIIIAIALIFLIVR